MHFNDGKLKGNHVCNNNNIYYLNTFQIRLECFLNKFSRDNNKSIIDFV